MDAAAGIGSNPVSKHQIQPEYRDEQADTGLPNPSRETKFSGANGGRKIFIFPVQLTTSRIGNLTRLILTLATCDDYTYIHDTIITILSGPRLGRTNAQQNIFGSLVLTRSVYSLDLIG